jgi:hypothetical protein
MDVRVMSIPQYERYVGQLHDALPRLHEAAHAQSAQQGTPICIGVLGGAIIDTNTQSWSLHDGATVGKRENLASLALSYPVEYGEQA